MNDINLLLNDSAAKRKARGAFFTPPEITDFLSEWAIRSPTDAVLEPSCGEAAFLRSAVFRLRQLGAAPITPSQLHGVDIHETSVRHAREQLQHLGAEAELTCKDFFDFFAFRRFDAVIGNPPYIRYQDFTGSARLKAKEAAFAQGVKLSGLASSWAAFVVHASSFLKQQGRLALVLPGELLTVSYAGPIRSFLMQRFGSVRLVVFEERVFPGVLEEVVLLLAEGQGPTGHCELFQATDLSALGALDERVWVPAEAEGKWTAAFLPPEAAEAYEEISSGSSFGRLVDWGETTLGMVSGNNRFFALDAARALELDLDPAALLPISPPGSRHLRGLTFTEKAWQAMRDEGAKVYLFSPPEEALSEAALRYIDAGETTGVHRAYKCRVRSPWWKVPTVPAPHLFFTYMNHDAPRLVANRARVSYLNSVHGVRLREGNLQLGMDLLPLASLNSVSLLGAELVGRAYGGGMLKLEPSEADVLPVPSRQTLEEAQRALRALRPQLSRFLRHGNLEEVVKLVDRVLLQRHLKVGRPELQVIREARELLFGRRKSRAGSKP